MAAKMRWSLLAAVMFLAACATAPSLPVAEVAPKGALRVAVAVGPAPSAFWATRDPASGEPRGVTVELGKAAATSNAPADRCALSVEQHFDMCQ